MNTNQSKGTMIYDEISEQYEKSQSLSQRKNIIKSKFEQFLEINNPRSLLDLGCGTGVFAIIAKQKCVGKVIGVDISSAQIKIAEDKAKSLGLEIEYLAQDIASLEIEQRFDAVSSVFGFCYTPTNQILRKQLISTYEHMEDESVIFAVVCHPKHPTRDWGKSYRVYAQGELNDGTKLKCDFLVDDKVVATDYKFYWTTKTWEDTLQDIGFSDITWEELEEYSTNIIFSARKQKS